MGLGRFDPAATAKVGCPGLHVPQTISAGAGGLGGGHHREPVTVVFDHHSQPAVMDGEIDLHGRSFGMLDDVRNRLLGNQEHAAAEVGRCG